jgi:hypothetical protein
MRRTSSEEVNYCTAKNECFDCHSNGKVKTAVDFQKRGKFRVPCCRAHFYIYKNKVNEASAKKYAKSSTAKREAGECTYKGCHHKLIPRELLPPWWKRENTCGIHVTFKAFRINREALLRFIIQHCLTPIESEGMTPQSVIYHAGQGYILLGLGKPGLYHTKCFSAIGLLKRYKRFRSQDPSASKNVQQTSFL